ncbi:MAG: ACP S-malonyltransferase [Anaerolineaceae bacterium]|nr:ACP S-malonyltransferase [Anaerolineaceae bacterium]
MSSAVLFPGQGSQVVGMGADLLSEFPATATIYEQAAVEMGDAFLPICFAGPAAALNDTAMAQPALYVHSMALWAAIRSARPQFAPQFAAGHSLGEFSALTAAGALDFAPGLHLVRRRGEWMRAAGESQPGGMAALLGLEASAVETLLADIRAEHGGTIVIANDNCPAQVVISGDQDSLSLAGERAKAAGARRVLPLNVSVATHSPLMASAAAEFAKVLADTPLRAARFPIIANVSGRPIQTEAEIRHELQTQLTAGVRWHESMRCLLATGVKQFYEVGAGNVLSGLLRRIDRSARAIPIHSAETLLAFLATA